MGVRRYVQYIPAEEFCQETIGCKPLNRLFYFSSADTLLKAALGLVIQKKSRPTMSEFLSGGIINWFVYICSAVNK